MRNAVIGLIIGIVAGIVLGTTVIAPRLAQNVKREIGLADAGPPDAPAADQQPGAQTDGAPDAANDATAAGETASDPADRTATKSAPGAKRINMASAYPETLAAHGTLAQRLSRTVWRISNGTLDLRFQPPGALVAEDEALDAVSAGAIDAYFTDLDVLAQRDPALTLIAGPPFGASVAAYLGWMSPGNGREGTGGGGRELLTARLEELGLGGTMCGLLPNDAGGWFKKPLMTVEDFKGKRVRATGVQAKLFETLGAEVVGFSYAETLIAMESGLIAGAQLSAPHVDMALGAARDGWTYYLPGWRVPARVFVLVMPLEKWQALSAIERSRIVTACGDNVRFAIAESEALQFEALRNIIKAGADVRPWPAEIADAARAAWQTMAAEMQKSSRPYSRIQKSYRQFIKGQSIWEELARPQ